MGRSKTENTGGEWKILALILGLSVMARIAAALWLGDGITDMPGAADQISYHTLAQQMLAGNGKAFTFPDAWWPATPAGAPTAHWSFLYTFYITAVYTLFGVHPLAARLIQAVLVGIIQPWLIYQIGSTYFGKKAGLVAAALTAVYIYFIYYAASLMTEPFYITAILGALLLAIKLAAHHPFESPKVKGIVWLAVGLGITLSAVVLLRQLFLLLIPFLFVWLFWAAGRKMLLPIVLATGILVAAILPFTFYNYQRFDRFVLLNTNAGFAFFWGNHPSYGDHFISILPTEAYLRMIPKELLSLDEAALDQALLKKAIGFVMDDPIRYFKLSVSRIPAYFMFWPSSESGLISNLSRVGSFGILFPFMLAGVFLAIRQAMRIPPDWARIKQISLLLGFCLLYTGLHLLTWALIRYRLPVDAVLLVFAALPLVKLLERVKS